MNTPVTEDGFLDTGIERILGRKNVCVLGDSFVESSYSKVERRFVAQTARKVDANVLNAGYSGMTLLHMTNILVNKIAAIGAPGDVAVLFNSMSNANALNTGGFWTNHHRYASVQPGYASTPPLWGGDSAALLSTMIHFARKIGLRPVIATSPFREEVDFNTESWLRKAHGRNRDAFNRMRVLYGNEVSVARKVAQDSKVELLDIHSQVGGASKFFYDEVHLNSHGQDVVAGILTRFLEEYLTGVD